MKKMKLFFSSSVFSNRSKSNSSFVSAVCSSLHLLPFSFCFYSNIFNLRIPRIFNVDSTALDRCNRKFLWVKQPKEKPTLLWTCGSPILAFGDDLEIKKLDERFVSFVKQEMKNRQVTSSAKPINTANSSSLVSPCSVSSINKNSKYTRKFSSVINSSNKETKNTSNSDLEPKVNEMDWTAVKDKIKDLINKNKVVLFIKGTPSAPMCGFSARVVNILEKLGVNDYTSVDVLAHPAVREGIKMYSNWPTIPQLYVDGNFIGGCDIVNELYNSGELTKMFEFKDKKKEEGL